MNLGVSGTRTPAIDYEVFRQWIDEIPEVTRIVSGHARGIDTYAERYAQERGLDLLLFIPDYQQFGKAAPFIRNQQIVDASDWVICFPSKESRGTLDTIKKAQRRGNLLKIVEI